MEELEIRKRMRDVLIQEYRDLAAKLSSKAQRIAELDNEIGDATDLGAIEGAGAPSAYSTSPAQTGSNTTGAKPKLCDDEFTGMTYQRGSPVGCVRGIVPKRDCSAKTISGTIELVPFPLPLLCRASLGQTAEGGCLHIGKAASAHERCWYKQINPTKQAGSGHLDGHPKQI